MTRDEALKLVEQLHDLMDYGGEKDDATLKEVKSLTGRLGWASIPGAQEKLGEIDLHAGYLFSANKHEIMGGPEAVRRRIRDDIILLQGIIDQEFGSQNQD